MKNISEYLEERLEIEISKKIADMINDEASFVEFPNKRIVLLEGMKSTNLFLLSVA